VAALKQGDTKGDHMATTKSATASGSGTMADTVNDMRGEFEQIDERLKTFVKERPIMALLSAVAAGYIVGRVLRRHG
jgi:hypothetical protein